MDSDRKLGDEWTEWDGNLDQYDLHIETGKRLFLGLSVGSIFLLAAGVMLIWYFIEPRVQQISSLFAAIFKISLYGLIFIVFLLFLQTVLSIIIRRNLLIRLGKKSYSITFLTPLILALGKKFGVSYDRIGHSFIKVSNSLILSNKWKINCGKILILLPRCLRRPIQKQIISIANKYQCLIYTVPGGELARKLIAEHKPLAVIGVACERDLLSGIRDVHHIPIIGIPNQRPEGPCKNTTVELSKIEDAIRFFIGSDLQAPTAQIHTAILQ
ncbi:MAG: DUF116 domain-containing protein [bacterium]|jgi:hypothetical protein|nr:DUF116 domain-containing protein [bacterium]